MFAKVISMLALPAALCAQQVAPMNDTAFHPITAQEAVRLAQENNVSAIQSTNQVRGAQNQLRSTRAGYLPDFRLSLGQTKSAGQRIGPSGTLIDYNSAWNYTLGFNSSMTLFDGGKTAADVRTQKANIIAAEAGQVTTQFSLAQQVKTQYNLILAAEESEAAARAQLTLAEQQLAIAIAKVNAGATTVSDSLRNVVTVANARLAILNAQQSIRTASAALTHLVGTPYLVTATASDTVDLPISNVDSAAVMQMAMSGPVIRQTESLIASAAAVERSAKSSYLPTVTAAFSYNGSGTGVYGIGPDPFPYSRGLNLGLSYPIFNRYQRENNIAAAQINIENAQAQLKDQRLNAQQGIITAMGALRNAEERIRVQQLNLRANLEDLRVNQQRYQLGAGLLLDVLISQSNLVLARQQLIQARLDYRNARAQIEAIIGRDLP